MLVNAASNPGPALWQGLMLLSLVWFLPWAFSKGKNSFRNASIAYALVGVGLFVLIITNSN